MYHSTDRQNAWPFVRYSLNFRREDLKGWIEITVYVVNIASSIFGQVNWGELGQCLA